MNKNIVVLTTILVLVVIDQLSKHLAPLFGFEILLNSGVSLNLLSSVPDTLLTFLMMLFGTLIFVLFKKDLLAHPVSFGLFFGGAISNILDRVFYGAVRDWLKIPFFDVHNNLADWFIFVGLIMFLVYNAFSSYIMKDK